MKKLVLATAIAATTFGAASTAFAETTVSANANLTTDYKFRGISQTNAGPAFQGGFDVAFGNGFYLGNWNSNVNFAGVGSGLSSSSAGLEMDFYGGYAGEFKGIGYDVGALYYFYEGVPIANGSPELNTLEVYGKLSYAGAYAKLSYAVSEDYFGQTTAAPVTSNDLSGSTYLDLGYALPLTDKLSLTLHYGLTNFDKDVTLGSTIDSYQDYSIGATYAFTSNYSVTAAYIDTENDAEAYFGKDLAEGSLVVTLSAKF
ncbi:MAG TPA: TorF family putative porin [Limnobacter sp.]|nr:TorF family putative porin [Limnobacter sp.]